MSKRLKRAIFITVAAVLVLGLLYAAVAFDVYTSVGRIPVTSSGYPSPHINRLIWPTIGCPAMVARGGTLEIEVDLRAGDGSGGQVEATEGWKAVATPVRKALSGLVLRLEPVRAWRAPSSRWPRGTRGGREMDVWHVEFRLPAETVPELYDLEVDVNEAGGPVTDRQPHSLEVVEDNDNTFTFVSLADVHVHERGISAWMQPQTDKGIDPDGRPVFFENAIDQVNLIRPDFVVILGDCVYAQRRAGEYQPEFEWFYRTLSRFEVPAFIVPGNHDQYVNEVDGMRVWEESIGPRYFSFDVGDCHFTALDTYDWPRHDRILMKKIFGLFTYPHKWQGQLLSPGDEKDPDTYDGELAWARDDLAAHGDARLRVMLVHQDPFSPDGKGIAWENETFAGVFSLGGNGLGKEAMRELASRYGVGLVLSGHLHEDLVGTAPSRDGGDRTVYASQTCVYFDEGGTRDEYPGYRLLKVESGVVKSLAYLDDRSSYPFYDGSVPGGKTDLDRLERPALRGGEAQAGNGWRVESCLGVPVEVRGLVRRVPVAASYPLAGARVYMVVPVPGDDSSVVLYATAAVPAGVPGKSATVPGTPAVLEVTPAN